MMRINEEIADLRHKMTVRLFVNRWKLSLPINRFLNMQDWQVQTRRREFKEQSVVRKSSNDHSALTIIFINSFIAHLIIKFL